MRDQGFNVILGLRKGSSWEKALSDGWLIGENLFEIEEAVKRGTIIQFCFLMQVKYTLGKR